MKTAAAFALGFAAGVVCLAVVLWSTGGLGPAHALAAPRVPEAISFTQPLPVAPRVQLPDAPPLPSRAATPPIPAVLDGPASPSLGMPVAGVDPRKLHSNFSQMRGDHAHEALDIMGPRGDRKSVVWGKRVDLGGRRTIKKKNHNRGKCWGPPMAPHPASPTLPAGQPQV